jgi:hypothetical protein
MKQHEKKKEHSKTRSFPVKPPTTWSLWSSFSVPWSNGVVVESKIEKAVELMAGGWIGLSFWGCVGGASFCVMKTFGTG